MKRTQHAGFSLVEIIVTVGLVSLLSTGVMMFYIESLKSGNASEQQIKLVSTTRKLSSELIFTGSRAHELILYNSTAPADRGPAGTPGIRKIVLNEETETDADDVCPTGNFAVFVFYELPKPASSAKYRISRLVGYYLETADSGPPSLMRMTIDLGSSPSTDPVETILTNNWSTAERQVMAPRVSPLALSDGYDDSTTPQLFYKRANQNIAVCGQLLHSATDKNTKDRRSYTRTFYFTVTVRS